jgi:hypothetical protein
MRASEIYHLATLKDEAQWAFDEIMKNFEDYEFEKDRAVYMIDILCGDAAGIYQLDTLINTFDIPVEDYEGPESDMYMEYWYDVDDFFYEIAEELNRVIELDNPYPSIEYSFAFGHGDMSGDYGLQLYVEK